MSKSINSCMKKLVRNMKFNINTLSENNIGKAVHFVVLFITNDAK